jgi:DNA topoisomerase-3
MQNDWRFVKDEALRERLKEAKGIGTPATRAEIIKGLERLLDLRAHGSASSRVDAGVGFAVVVGSVLSALPPKVCRNIR